MVLRSRGVVGSVPLINAVAYTPSGPDRTCRFRRALVLVYTPRGGAIGPSTRYVNTPRIHGQGRSVSVKADWCVAPLPWMSVAERPQPRPQPNGEDSLVESCGEGVILYALRVSHEYTHTVTRCLAGCVCHTVPHAQLREPHAKREDGCSPVGSFGPAPRHWGWSPARTDIASAPASLRRHCRPCRTCRTRLGKPLSPPA